MVTKQGKTCPICLKERLFYLNDHLRQVHKLSKDERRQQLKTAKYTPTQTIACDQSSDVEQTPPVKRLKPLPQTHKSKERWDSGDDADNEQPNADEDSDDDLSNYPPEAIEQLKHSRARAKARENRRQC